VISTGCSTSTREVNADPTLSKPAVITVGELRSAKLPKAGVIAVEEEPAHGVEDEAHSAWRHFSCEWLGPYYALFNRLTPQVISSKTTHKNDRKKANPPNIEVPLGHRNGRDQPLHNILFITVPTGVIIKHRAPLERQNRTSAP